MTMLAGSPTLRIARYAALVIFAASASGHAQQPTPTNRDLVERLPRAWCGTFRWEASSDEQRVTITFDRVALLADGKIEAAGPGLVRTSRTVRFTARAVIEPDTLRVDMFEEVPPTTTGYITDGSHVGELAADLQSMRLAWTTRATGERGSMELVARPPQADLTQPCGRPSS
jgi:hypothetical protein